MSKRRQMSSCLIIAIAGFVLLCPVLSGRAFGDFQLQWEETDDSTVDTDQAGSTSEISETSYYAKAQSTLNAVTEASTHSATRGLVVTRQWKWVGDPIDGAHTTATLTENLWVTGSISADAIGGMAVSTAQTALLGLEGSCAGAGNSYSRTDNRTLTDHRSYDRVFNNNDTLTEFVQVKAKTTASVSVYFGVGNGSAASFAQETMTSFTAAAGL